MNFGRRLLAPAAALVATFALLPALASAAQPTLQYGQHGTEVKILQRDLTAVGDKTTVTGSFNHATRSSVVTFQKKHRLSADGVVGPQTWKAMNTILKALTSRPDVASSTAIATPATLPADDSGGAGIVPADPTTSTGAGTTGTTTTGTTTAPVEQATLDSDGLAIAPADAPTVVQEVIAAANKIAFDPYVYGGGHNGWGPQSGYDCSGSVSYALHAGGLLGGAPLDSSGFAAYGEAGAGTWITIWTDPGYHTYMDVAGLWFDTAAQSAANGNDRWSTTRVSPASGFEPRHPAGW